MYLGLYIVDKSTNQPDCRDTITSICTSFTGQCIQNWRYSVRQYVALARNPITLYVRVCAAVRAWEQYPPKVASGHTAFTAFTAPSTSPDGELMRNQCPGGRVSASGTHQLNSFAFYNPLHFEKPSASRLAGCAHWMRMFCHH